MSLDLNQAESLRLSALRSYRILDTPKEPSFDNITRLITMICEVPFSLVTFIDHDRQWVKSCHGVDIKETSREVAFCNHTIQRKGIFIVRDTHKDPRFANHPLVVGPPYIRFYVGIPLLDSNGRAIGSICALDKEPRHLQAPELELFSYLADQAMQLLEERRRGEEKVIMQNSLVAMGHTMTEGVLAEDGDRKVTFFNVPFAEIFGYSGTNHLKGKHISHVLKWVSMQGIANGSFEPPAEGEHRVQMHLTNGRTIEIQSNPIFNQQPDSPRVWIFRSW